MADSTQPVVCGIHFDCLHCSGTPLLLTEHKKQRIVAYAQGWLQARKEPEVSIAGFVLEQSLIAAHEECYAGSQTKSFLELPIQAALNIPVTYSIKAYYHKPLQISLMYIKEVCAFH